MKRGHPPYEFLVKQGADAASQAEAFLAKKAARPQPEWYAKLLEEHEAEIALVIAWWFAEIQQYIATLSWVEWTDPLLWVSFESMLARRLSPALRAAGVEAARRQAVEAGEPIPILFADAEVSAWSETEAARQAHWIATETRMALVETFATLESLQLPVEDRRQLILDGGLFALNRRFAGSALRPLVEDGVGASDRVIEHGERLGIVRRTMIASHNAVSSVIEGLLIAGLFWEQDGKLVTKTWVAQLDERLCPVCFSMHMQEAPLRGTFVAANGRTYSRPPAHPLCRCFVRLGVRAQDVLEAVV